MVRASLDSRAAGGRHPLAATAGNEAIVFARSVPAGANNIPQPIETERWLRFFKDGEHLDDEALPAWMQTEEMQQAMGTVRQFSEKERKYHAYQARLNYLREQQSIQAELAQAKQMAEQVQRERERERQEKEQARRNEEQARRSEEQARRSEEQARQDKEAALAEIERLKAALAKQQGDS